MSYIPLEKEDKTPKRAKEAEAIRTVGGAERAIQYVKGPRCLTSEGCADVASRLALSIIIFKIF